MIYDWLYRKLIKPIIDECLRQSKPNAPVKLDPFEYPTMAKRGVTHVQHSKVRGCPPIFLLPPKPISVSDVFRSMGIDVSEEVRAQLDAPVDIDVRKPRMRCHQSWFYWAGVPCPEQTWTCVSDSAQGVGSTALAAWTDWALRLSRLERDARGIHLER